MLQLSLALLLFLALFASLETAPSSSSGAKHEKYVRVYEINEEQYQRVLQLTKGKNVISEARLINGGFATVSDTLSSGWNSLLRIVGLTTLSKADETEKVDFDGQPLCVIKSREGEGREEDVPAARSSARDIEAEEEDSAIHCIVVLKKDVEFELPTLDPHPNYAQYWNKPETSNPVAETPVLTQSSEVLKEEEAVETETRIQAPLKKKKVNKSIYPRTGALGDDSDGSRQYGYPPLPPQYGTPYPPPPSYGGYPYSPYPNPPPYPNPQPYGPQLPYGPSPYGQPSYGLYPQQPYGPQPPIPPYSPQPYGPYGYPYLDQNQLAQVNAQKEVEKLEADDDEEEDEDSYETEDENDYRYKNRLYSYNPVYLQQSYNN